VRATAKRRGCCTAPGSTDDGWQQLRATRNRIAGQLSRRKLRRRGGTDADRNLIPLRRSDPD
jgi:hypothetical protein